MTTTDHRIAVIPGDGIGTEVVPAAQRVLDAAGARFGIGFHWGHFDWGCERYVETGALMPDDGLEQIADHDAILMGAVGHLAVPDHISLWGLLIPIRRAFRQYVNLRPIKRLRGIDGPLRPGLADQIDILVVRENNEGEYSEIGGRLYAGTDDAMAVQETVFTRRGVRRAARYACGLAGARSGDLVSATKSNGIIHTMPFWDEVVAEVVADHEGVEVRPLLIDALAAALVLRPDTFDVILASNLFGDILTDLGAAVVGGIGIAPSANLNPERDHPSMFEAIHGSAPDIAGQGVANPIGQIWSGALMLEHLGHTVAATAVVTAIEDAIDEPGARTPDLGGTATTGDMVDGIIDRLRA